MLAAAAAAAAAAPGQQRSVAGQQQLAAERRALPAAFCDADSSLMMSVQCPICYDTLADPVSTPWGQTFCQPCIRHWLSSIATCPVTRQPLSVQQLVPNYALAGLLEKMGRLTAGGCGGA
jgi:hypothetical protein